MEHEKQFGGCHVLTPRRDDRWGGGGAGGRGEGGNPKERRERGTVGERKGVTAVASLRTKHGIQYFWQNF